MSCRFYASKMVDGNAYIFERTVMTITLKEVARLAGVSVATASRVINNQPGVSAKVRQRVLQVVHEQNYQPNLFAQSLAAQRLRKKNNL